jgi:Replication-relaxation
MGAESVPTPPEPPVSPASPGAGGPDRPGGSRKPDAPTGMRSLPEGVRVLRGHLVERRPTRRDRATRPGLVLTERDGRILEAVYHHGLLPTGLLLLAFFPPASGAEDAAERRARSSAGAERLRLLWLWDLLARVEQPVAPALGGRRPYLYALGPAAVPVLTERLGVTARAVHRRRLDRLDARALEHDHQAARLWALLTAHRPQTRLTGFRWEAELSLRARKLRVRVRPAGDDGAGGGGDGQGKGRVLPFLPDGYLELDYPDRAVQCCVLEVDRGTQPLRKFARKLLAFEALLQEGLFARHFGREAFEVLVLAPSAARRRHLHAAARGVVSEDRWEWYLFATPEALTPAVFPDGWWPLDRDDPDDAGGECGLFFEQATEVGGSGPDGRPG